MSKLAKTLQAAAGNAGGGGEYVEDVFSTYLYTGNSTARDIQNDIDLDGEGGMAWIKWRSGGQGYGNHELYDTNRGATKAIESSSVNAEATRSGGLTAFNSDGFSLGTFAYENGNGNFASWSFRKAPKFFDVVTYDGNSTAGRTVAHNLGSVPGMIIVKRLTGAGNWIVYHKDLNGGTNPEQYYVMLNATNAQALGGTTTWNNTAPTSTEFTLGTSNSLNGLEESYVAYLFAHDAGGFGDDGEQNVISCGSYTGNGSTSGPEITLGYEPQWLLIKRSDASAEWRLSDSMRGMPTGLSGLKNLKPNDADSEGNVSIPVVDLTSTGFRLTTSASTYNASSGTYIYIAIRRGPMKTPESGTEVFAIGQGDGDADVPDYISNFPVDTAITKRTSAGNNGRMSSRLTGAYYLSPNLTQAESYDGAATFDFMNGWGSDGANRNTDEYAWMFRRAPGFFDEVCYTGTGSNMTVAHNLGVAPELIINKSRSNVTQWSVFSNITPSGYVRSTLNSDTGSATVRPYLNTGDGYGLSAQPDATNIYWENLSSITGSGRTFVTYLFASCPGVSKVGSYTGTGADLNVDCGFSAGARFILIKRTDSTGDWYVWDSARGIVSGNDPYLLLNSTAAENTSTDYIDPLASGFTVTSSAPAALNASGVSYIFLAIA